MAYRDDPEYIDDDEYFDPDDYSASGRVRRNVLGGSGTPPVRSSRNRASASSA